MKKSVAIFFLFVMAFPMLSKVGWISFYQLNRDYITENYCVNRDQPIAMCYGQCFLNKGIQLVDESSKPAQLTTQHKIEMPASITSIYTATIPYWFVEISFHIKIIANPLAGFISSVFRPPLV